MARTLLRRAAENPLLARAVSGLERLDGKSPRLLRVLTYHRVDEGQAFARQMEHVAARYRVVSVAEVLNALDGGEALPPLSVLLTFDDAYTSFARVAWPILVRHAFPAALFVPTAFPDSASERFWWDRVDQAFAATARRDELVVPAGRFPLATPEQRAAAHAAVKRWIKDRPHRETLAATDALCAELGVPGGAHEVLGWAELRRLAAEGVTLGAHTRTHPRLDRIAPEEARAELRESVRDLERELPGLARVFAYPDGRFSDDLVECARAAGVELAFTTRPGAVDLALCDRLRLRRIHVDARDSVEVLRAKLVLGAARWNRVRRLFDPPTPAERASERAGRAERRRVQYVARPLDAALTARLRPREALLPALRRVAGHASNYERVGVLVRQAARTPALEARLARALLDTAHLSLRGRVELLAYGSGTTVFRLEPERPGAAPRVLKIYRRTIGRDAHALARIARRHRERHLHLCQRFGALVHPAEFLVLHGPLRGQPAVACTQEFLPGRLLDPLALGPGELAGYLASRPALARALGEFARQALSWRARGLFPDLLGQGNLVVAERPEGARLLLIDYGVFDLRALAPGPRARLDALAQRLHDLASRLEEHVALPR